MRLWEQEGSRQRLDDKASSGAANLLARDVWQNLSLGLVRGDHLNATVGPHEVRLFRVWRAADTAATSK